MSTQKSTDWALIINKDSYHCILEPIIPTMLSNACQRCIKES